MDEENFDYNHKDNQQTTFTLEENEINDGEEDRNLVEQATEKDEGDKHWVALQIDFRSWVVYVYDSNVDLYDTKFVENSLLPVTRGLSLVLKQYGPMAKQLEKWGEKSLSFSRDNDLKPNK